MATHSSVLAWRIPWTGDPGGLQSMESQRIGQDWTHTPTPVYPFAPFCFLETWLLHFLYFSLFGKIIYLSKAHLYKDNLYNNKIKYPLQKFNNIKISIKTTYKQIIIYHCQIRVDIIYIRMAYFQASYWCKIHVRKNVILAYTAKAFANIQHLTFFTSNSYFFKLKKSLSG